MAGLREGLVDIYHAFKPGISDITFAERVAAYPGHLKEPGLIECWRLTRRKLGFGAPGLGEFHLEHLILTGNGRVDVHLAHEVGYGSRTSAER